MAHKSSAAKEGAKHGEARGEQLYGAGKIALIILLAVLPVGGGLAAWLAFLGGQARAGTGLQTVLRLEDGGNRSILDRFK